MARYVAHYQSPKGKHPQSGEFVFESAHPVNSRSNVQDARYLMLELFGKEAVSWQIVKTERASQHQDDHYVQPNLDFREPEQPKRRRRSVERGKL